MPVLALAVRSDLLWKSFFFGWSVGWFVGLLVGVVVVVVVVVVVLVVALEITFLFRRGWEVIFCCLFVG